MTSKRDIADAIWFHAAVFLSFVLGWLMSGWAFGQGVQPPPGGFNGNRIHGPGVRSNWHGPPADDNAKWHVALYYDNKPESQQLLNDFRTDANLKAIAEWGHFNAENVDLASQEIKRQMYGVNEPPQLFVFPPKDGDWPYEFVFRHKGYNGNAEHLAASIDKMVRAFKAKHSTQFAWRAVDTMYRKAGLPAFGRGPWDDQPCPGPGPSPVEPQFPDLDIDPNVLPDGNVIPKWPQITIILDKQAVFEEGEIEALLRQAFELMRTTHHGFCRPKVRWLFVQSKEARGWPAGPGDTPILFISDDGEILSVLRGDIHLQIPSQRVVPLPQTQPVPQPSADPACGKAIAAMGARLEAVERTLAGIRNEVASTEPLKAGDLIAHFQSHPKDAAAFAKTLPPIYFPMRFDGTSGEMQAIRLGEGVKFRK